jgi:uncharacterized protein (TIGR03435 family)
MKYNLLGHKARNSAINGVAGVLIAACLLFSPDHGRAADARPVFEVASLKSTPPVQAGRVQRRCEEDRLTIRYHTLKMLILWAYDATNATLSLPAWMEDPAQGLIRFDVDAKSAGPVPVAEMRLMLQSLLEERFGLRLHREIRDEVRPVLRVGKKGQHLTPAAPVGTDQVRNVTPDPVHGRDIFRAAGVGTVSTASRRSSTL